MPAEAGPGERVVGKEDDGDATSSIVYDDAPVAANGVLLATQDAVAFVSQEKS